MSFTRIMAVGASSLGLLALLLSAIGVFGVVAYSVTQRTREIGIRMAFGCTRLGVLALVVHGGLGLALPGLVVGGTVAVGFGHVIRAGLVGVSPLDPAALGSVGLLMLVVVVVASLLPAIRASLVEPVEALRCD